MGFVRYFLIVQDFINSSKRMNIPVGRAEEAQQAALLLMYSELQI